MRYLTILRNLLLGRTGKTYLNIFPRDKMFVLLNKTIRISSLLGLSFFLHFTGCKSDAKLEEHEPLFVEVSAATSGIDFENAITESEDFHYYQYIYSYNGAGVASADFNNDGLMDLFFTANTSGNKLYLNKGDFQFEDITQHAKIEALNGFNMGVSVVDINSDGYMDIYICRAGWYEEEEKLKNLLYINNGDLTFTEVAEKYGLADENRSIAACFFDYDKDGDLDVYIANAPNVTRDYREILDLDAIKKDPKTLKLKGSDKLYENNGSGKFIDVSINAGIHPDRAFGLNPQVGDLNGDGWMDVYVSNDFDMPDFAYINNGDGTFSDRRNQLVKHMSFYSMGSDIADINNDGENDLVVLDMSPEDYIRSKTTMSMTSIDRFWEMVENGYHYQYMHNVLQVNNGNGTYSEVGNMAGIANTDWSWAPLVADFDLDGHKDIFITNGIYRDVIDQDINRKIVEEIRAKGQKPSPSDYLKYTQMLPQQKLDNYFFKNNGDLTFSDTSKEWIDLESTFSNGAVYVDLDNDGDLDIVVNNINDTATILKNKAIENDKGSYLQIQLLGPENNKNGIGTKVTLSFDNGQQQVRNVVRSRGYLSAISNKVHFGFLRDAVITEAVVQWPDGKTQALHNSENNQLLTVRYDDANHSIVPKEITKEALFQEVPFNYGHKDSIFDDFQIQLLLPHKLSQLGPGAALGDVNNDGFQDIYLGGGYMQEGALMIGQPSGKFKKQPVLDFKADLKHEDTGATFFDIDNDGDLDLYVVSGSYEFAEHSPLFKDRIYINNGQGQFVKCDDCLPEFFESGSVVTAGDFDNDGDDDLFVGSRLISGRYPYAPKSYLLENQNGAFKVKTESLAPELLNIGMVTDAVWNDIDNDGDLDLILTGEWMGVEVFINQVGRLSKSDSYPVLSGSKGWWNKLMIDDIDGDGDKDIIAGNLGTNSKYHASAEKPFHIYTKDFDYNGTEDVVLAKYYGNKQVPIRGKSCTAQQMPFLHEKIKTYNDFANNDLKGILGEGLESALHLEVTEFSSGIFMNNGGVGFEFQPLPNTCQKSPINSIVYSDFDGDGNKDLLLAGNNHQMEIETTRMDAGVTCFLRGNGIGDFSYKPNKETGLFADKDIRNMLIIENADHNYLLIVNNNGEHGLYRLQ